MKIDENQLTKALREISAAEHARLVGFLESHELRRFRAGDHDLDYYRCGKGDRTILIFAGGWGGPQLVYDTVLGLEEDHQVVVIDVSPFDDGDRMADGVNLVLAHEGIDRVVVLGQSLSGILGQIYLKRNPDRVEAIVLINTIAPRIERCKKWVLVLFQLIPFPLLKALMARTMGRLAAFDSEIPPEAIERVTFRMAFMRRVTGLYMTRRVMINVLRLAYAFNERDTYRPGDFAGWPGRPLIITSEDDTGYADVEILKTGLPNAEVFVLPTGFRHVAPMIYRDQLYAEIHRFLKSLDKA